MRIPWRDAIRLVARNNLARDFQIQAELNELRLSGEKITDIPAATLRVLEDAGWIVNLVTGEATPTDILELEVGINVPGEWKGDWEDKNDG